LRKAALVPLFMGVLCLSGYGRVGWGQEAAAVGGVDRFGFSTTWSPDSSHILIGLAQQRRTWTLGAEYARRLNSSERVRFEYEGSVLPLYEETDPTVIGTTVTLGTQTFNTPQSPVRVVAVAHGPVGTATEGPLSAPIYAVFGRQDTYAWSLAPLGIRASLFPHRHIEPSLALDAGFVVSHRDIPVDNTDRFNYMFAFGPAVEFFVNPKTSWRLEYIYRHLSNAGEGALNPGIDQGVVRVTLNLYR
jgi:hypothetical protein